MRYVTLMLALALTLCVGVCKAEDGKAESASAGAAVMQEEDSDEGIRHIDLGEEPIDQMGVMAPGESYDEETGLPDVVESDDDMELQ